MIMRMQPIPTDEVAWSFCLCVSVSVTNLAKTTEPVEMPVGMWNFEGPRNRVLDGSPDGKGHIWGVYWRSIYSKWHLFVRSRWARSPVAVRSTAVDRSLRPASYTLSTTPATTRSRRSARRAAPATSASSSQVSPSLMLRFSEDNYIWRNDSLTNNLNNFLSYLRLCCIADSVFIVNERKLIILPRDYSSRKIFIFKAGTKRLGLQ